MFDKKIGGVPVMNLVYGLMVVIIFVVIVMTMGRSKSKSKCKSKKSMFDIFGKKKDKFLQNQETTHYKEESVKSRVENIEKSQEEILGSAD